MKAVILNDTRHERHHGCTRVMENLYKSLDENQIDISRVSYLNQDLMSNDLAAALGSCDFAIVNGEGTIHHGKSYAEDLLRVVANSKATTKVLLNSTYQSNPTHYREYLANFDHVYVRDHQSKNELAGIGIASQVVPDLTFLSQPDSNYPSCPNTLVGCSVDREVTVHLYKLARTLGDRARPLSIFNKSENVMQRAVEIRRSVAVRDLRTPTTAYRNARARAWFSSNACGSHQEFSRTLASCAFLVSGRYHAICMAIKNKTPFLAVDSNTFKIRALLDDIGLEGRCISKTDLLAGVDVEFRSFSEKEIELIERFNENARSSNRNMFAQIFQNE